MVMMDPYDNDYSYSFGGYNYSVMGSDAQTYDQFDPYTESYGNEWEDAPCYFNEQLNTPPSSPRKSENFNFEYPIEELTEVNEWEDEPSYSDQQLYTSPPPESETPTEQQLFMFMQFIEMVMQWNEMIQEFLKEQRDTNASILASIRNLEYQVEQLIKRRRERETLVEVTPEVSHEDGMDLKSNESPILSSFVPSVITMGSDHVEYVVDVDPKCSCLVLKSLFVGICLDSGKVNSLFYAMNSSNQTWWWGLRPISLTLCFFGGTQFLRSM